MTLEERATRPSFNYTYKEEIDSISKTYSNLYKDFKKREISDNEKLEGYSHEIEKLHIFIILFHKTLYIIHGRPPLPSGGEQKMPRGGEIAHKVNVLNSIF